MTRERGPYGCRIVVRGEMGDRFATQFEGMTLERGDGVSTLVGTVADQAEVYGLLEQVQDLGLDLVSVDTADAVDPVGAEDGADTAPTPHDPTPSTVSPRSAHE